MTDEEMTQLAINTIRTLSIDAVQQAKSGHPGTPMALAPLIYTIWNRVMRCTTHQARFPSIAEALKGRYQVLRNEAGHCKIPAKLLHNAPIWRYRVLDPNERDMQRIG